jgi:predicted DNA-binding protein YlxM (UPF0122 family)
MARDLRLRLKPQELRQLYQKEKRSLEEIARLFGVSRVAVWKYCQALNLARRDRSQARLLAQKRGKVPQNYFQINERFFKQWTPEMAYVLGLIATDGNVSRTGTVSLCINDKELLERVKQAMGSDHQIKYYGHQAGLHSFHFARQELVEDLAKLGLLPNKSLSLKFPQIPEAFLADFIRGVFDGDGSVFFEKRSPNLVLCSKFHSGSKDFIEALECKLRTLGMPARTIYQQPTKNGIYYMFKYGHQDSQKLFKILYQNRSPKCLFLDRKFNRFLEGLGANKNEPSPRRA